MKLTSSKALELIENERDKKPNNNRWIDHSICVGNVAGKIAKALNLDEDYAKTHYHIKETYKLKEFFDNLLGYNLYDLFPEIKENL